MEDVVQERIVTSETIPDIGGSGMSWHSSVEIVRYHGIDVSGSIASNPYLQRTCTLYPSP